MYDQNGQRQRPLQPAQIRAIARRDYGRERVRRVTAWTAATLVAGMAAGAGYFAHATTATSGTASQVTSGSAHVRGQRPSLSHPVVTSAGSGVTAGSTAGSGGAGGGAGYRDN
jgi:hypothetical protein